MADRSCNPEDKKPVRSNATGGKITKNTRSKRVKQSAKEKKGKGQINSSVDLERDSSNPGTADSERQSEEFDSIRKKKTSKGNPSVKNHAKSKIQVKTNQNNSVDSKTLTSEPNQSKHLNQDPAHTVEQLSPAPDTISAKRKRKKTASVLNTPESPGLIEPTVVGNTPQTNKAIAAGSDSGVGSISKHPKRQYRKKQIIDETKVQKGSLQSTLPVKQPALNDSGVLIVQQPTSVPAPVIIHPSGKKQRKARTLKKCTSDSQLDSSCEQKVVDNQEHSFACSIYNLDLVTKSTASPGRKRKGAAANKGTQKKTKQENQSSKTTLNFKDKGPAQAADKTGGKVSRGRSQRAGSSGNSSTTGSCSSTRRSRRTRAQEEPVNMATQEGSGQPSEANGSQSRVEDPTPSSSSNAHDSDSNIIEDAEMSRLQALLEARGLPAHLFGSLGPRMHLLLHRTFSSGTGSKAQQLLTGMQSEEEGQQLQSVMEMCQLLVMGNEETLGGFPVKQAVPILITLLQMEHNFDIMNHACRALTYLMEALPRSSAVVIDAIPAFLEKLQVIQCMDVAEQSLTALEMLSRRHGKAILQAGGLASSLLYLDFFSIVAQRSALAIAANCCHSVSPEEFHHVKGAIVILSGRLANQDKKSIESVCLAFARLVDNFQKDQKLLEKLCSHGLLNNLQQLLVVSPPIISTGTFVMVVRMLAVMCGSCPSIAVELLKQNISETIRYLLIGSTEDSMENADTVELVPRSPQELYEITCLISELMPNLPSIGIFAVDTLLSKGTDHNTNTGCWQWRDDRGTWHSYMWVDNRILEAAYQSGEDEISLSTLGRNYIIDFTNMQQINEDTGTVRPIQRKPGPGQNANNARNEKEKQNVDERALLLNSETELAKTFINSLLGVVFDVYYSSVGPAVKHKCLHAVLKMLYHYPSPELEDTLQKLPISSYIAGMMASPDMRTVCSALQMAEILMNKLPDVFHVFFRREGVMHKAQSLSCGSGCLLAQREAAQSKDILPKPADRLSAGASVDNGFDGSCEPVVPELPSTPRISDALKKRRITKRAGRNKGAKSLGDDATSPSSKKAASDSLRPRSSTFSASTSSSSSSKTSFFSSFAPRWGRSQSYGGAPGSSGKGGKESYGKQQDNNKEEIKKWIQEQATNFFSNYFAEEAGDSHPALSVLHQLTKAAGDLCIERDCALTPLRDIALVVKEESRSEDGASAFEILHSGLVGSLLKYLTSESLKEAVSRELRLKRFLHVFLGCPEPDSVVPKTIITSTKPALAPLIQKLNLCINQLEQFLVKCHDLPGSGAGSRGTSALRFFNTHQIKCNLQRLPDCTNLRQWKGGPVKIDPLALVQAIERYLVVRGYGRIREGTDEDDSDLEERSDDEIDESWASQLQGSSSPKHYLEFVLNGHVLPYNMTVYQAVRQYGTTCYDENSEVDEDQGPFGRASIWSETHTIWYRPMTQVAGANSTVKKRVDLGSKSSTRSTLKNIHRTKSSDVALFLSQTVNVSLSTSDPSLEVISLMRVIYFLNVNWGLIYESPHSQAVVSVAEFINTKLTAKAMRQLQDPLVIMTGNLPQWLSELALACPFIFPFECRQQLFYASTFDRDRAMMKLQENVPDLSSSEAADRVTPRLEKKKRTVSRSNLLKQTESVMNDLANSKALLEIQYEGEVGTGLGPTLEFYALTSKEFQKAEVDMWRGDVVEVVEGDGEHKETMQYLHSPNGLFPKPIPKSLKGGQLTKIKSRFRLLGRFVAKAIMDSRMIDIPFSQSFYKWMLGQEATLDLADLQFTDTVLYKSLSQLNDVVARKKRIEDDSSHTPESLQLCLGSLTLDGLPIEDLGLDFVLPGQANIELKKNGRDIPVTIANLEEYVKLVTHWILVEGVTKQMHAFREGFDSVFPSSSLRMFYPGEMDLLLCGSRSEKWDSKELIDCCRPDHGYTHDSRAIRLLFEILSKYAADDQRRFLQFITGSPRLPVGGFRSLNPPLTIVRKTVDPSANPDNYLPSVMTCVNYLKLPDYSSLEIMAQRLRTAYTEGKNAFHLS